MDEQFKEIEGLLEDAEPVEPRSFKKYAKLILPHVALVAVVCLYAVVGAWIFYSLESPNEDRLKRNGVLRINDLRKELVSSMWEKGRRGMMGISMEQWMSNTDRRLQKFNENLYRAFKEEYVRYPDVRITKSSTESHESNEEIKRLKRHRKAKTRSEKGEKLWTASSALFFAATTMATIGYGNIVPVTPYGRIACVVFALFGAPLAIITIGDLGKFLSECTIWLYKKMKKGRNLLSYRFRKWRLRKSGIVTEIEEDMPSESEHSTLHWDDLVMDKTEVPVLLVFAILLLYIAFGGVLFAVLESWTYMDAFYYCFVSLTTIGFGDLVPERHEYIVLMLIYLGVGLAVTTMCIDLVGIQYIQKIHYFGRKFRGTDLLHLLKRKRMIERRLAMGHGEEILQMYLQHLQDERPEPPIPTAQPHWNYKEEFAAPYDANENIPEWQVDETIVDNALSFDVCNVEKLHTPSVFSVRSIRQPTTPSVCSSSTASARSIMYSRQQVRTSSWTDSGLSPEVSIHCSLSTEPSVLERELIYNNYHTPVPSLMSFDYEFPIPSPDLHIIAEYAKRSRHVRSCPSNINVPSRSPLVSLTSSVRKWIERRYSLRNAECRAAEAVVSPRSTTVCTLNANCFRISEPFMLSKLAAQCDLLERMQYSTGLFRFDMPAVAETRLESAVTQNDSATTLLPNENAACLLSNKSMAEVVGTPSVFQHIPRLNLLAQSPPSCARLPRPKLRHELAAVDGVESNVTQHSRTLFADTERRQSGNTNVEPMREPNATVAAQSILRRKKKERRARRQDPLSMVEWLNISPRAQLMQTIRNDLPTLFNYVRSGNSPHASSESVVLVSPRNPIGLVCMEEWDSYIKMLDEYCKPYVSASSASKAPSPSTLSPPEPPEVTFVVPNSEPEIKADEEVIEEEGAVSITILTPLAVEASAITVTVEEHEIAESEVLDETTTVTSTHAVCITHESCDSSSSTESLIEFPLHLNVDLRPFSNDFNDTSGIFDANANGGDEAVYHMGLGESQVPVFATDSRAFDVRSALRNALTCPVKYISRLPPTMVSENYCFVVDGDAVSMDAINAGSEQWWKGTGTTIRYYYSEELKKFYQVNALLSRGEVRCAYKVKGRGGGMEQVPLDRIFKVSRHFSYWDSCSGFHRIISVISPITKTGEMRSGFRRRIFVQYLWRTNKPSDRQRISQEYERRRKMSKTARTSIDAGRPPVSLTLSPPNLQEPGLSLQTGADIAAFIQKTVHGRSS